MAPVTVIKAVSSRDVKASRLVWPRGFNISAQNCLGLETQDQASNCQDLHYIYVLQDQDVSESFISLINLTVILVPICYPPYVSMAGY